MPWPEEGSYLRRQVLEPAYALNGAIYIIKTSVFKKTRSYFTNKTFAYLMPKERSIDIDESIDLFIAEQIINFQIKY
jgi:N-acylneuraminate cytidylyltransferase/CMP-N,N'-diacetyllegionaminic acid synthase